MVRIAPAAVHNVLDYVSATAVRQSVHFLWRPRLADVKDDVVLEAAVNRTFRIANDWLHLLSKAKRVIHISRGL